MDRADVLVIGLGAMGAAATWQLARRGASVIGIDRFAPPHALGSTHGDSRVTRVACAEGAAYVPLARRSHELWREVEAQTGTDLLEQCGVLMVGPGSGLGSMHGTSDWIGASVDLAQRFGVPHEVLDGAAARERWPMFAFADEAPAYFEPGGGFVRPEAAVAAQLELARRDGARIEVDSQVVDLRSSSAGVEVRLTDGRAFGAERAVLAVGAWVGEFVDDPALRSTFAVYRQALHWFELDPAWCDRVGPEQLPVHLWSFGPGATEFFYGFPAIDGPEGGIKVATEQFTVPSDPDDVEREVGPDEARTMHVHCLRDRLLAVRDRPLRSVSCLYTVTPDSDFRVDEHPELPGVLLVSPCSGHGFKHSAALGEAIAERTLHGPSTIDLSPFALAR